MTDEQGARMLLEIKAIVEKHTREEDPNLQPTIVVVLPNVILTNDCLVCTYEGIQRYIQALGIKHERDRHEGDEGQEVPIPKDWVH